MLYRHTKKAEACYHMTLDLCHIFDIRHLHPSVYITIHLASVQIFLTQGNVEKCLDALEQYVDTLCDENVFPFQLQGNDFFDRLDELFDSLVLGTAPPRSEQLIKQDMKDCIIKNPAFAPLHSQARFEHLVKKLEQI